MIEPTNALMLKLYFLTHNLS